MKGLSSNITKTITSGTVLNCADNSGARKIKVMNVLGYKGVRGRSDKTGIGDIIVGSVKKGKPDMRKTMVKALVVRQKKEYRRANGLRIFFEDNAGVVVNEEFLPVGTEIKGVVAREISERFPKVAAIASGVV